MARTKISEFSATAGSNTDIDSINLAEGCAPSGINDAIRELMSQLKDFQTGAVGDSFNGPVGSTTAGTGAFTTLAASSTTTLSGLTASTALALDASKNVVSVTNTGTGSNVLATSPTFVTPVLGTPSSGTVTNLTGTASININGTVGATTPAAGSFTTLSASGQSSFGGVLQISGAGVPASGGGMELAGSASNSSITAFNRSLGTYLTQYFNALEYNFSTSGTERMRLTSTGLGIGTSSPAYKLDVSGTAASQLRLQNSDATSYASMLFSGTGRTYSIGVGNASETGIQVANQFYIYDSTAGAVRVRLDASGNLGLGVTPSAWGGSYKAFQLTNTGRSLAATGAGAGDLTLAFNAIYDSTDSRWEYAATGDAAVRYSQTGAGIHAWYNAAVGTAGNEITFTQALTLDASGFLFLGCTTTPSASVKGIRLTPDFTTNTPKFSTGSATGLVYMIEWINGNGIVGSISTNGSLTSYNVSSDYRLKNITGPITSSGAYIDSLKPVEGTWKANGSKFIGLIAHEVQEVSQTDVVTGEKDGEKMQAMDYSSSEIIANMIAELKSLRQRVATLEAQ